MKRGFAQRFVVVALALAVLAAAGGAIGLHVAARTLQEQVRKALGPDAQVGEISLGWSAVTVRDIRVPGPANWPASDTLRAARITVVPDFAALFSSRQVHIQQITVSEAYLSVLRTREGRVRLLPSLLEQPADARAADGQNSPGGPSGLPVIIDHIALHGSALEFFDASVAKPPHKLRLEQLEARVDDLRLPELRSRTALELAGSLQGPRHRGHFGVKGWVVLASKDSEIVTQLREVDLVALQPYLIKAAETGVKGGTLDLDLKSTVKDNRLHAPGKLTVRDLELAPAQGGLGTFMGMPRQAVVAVLKGRDGRFSIQFALDGRLDDPQFSLNDVFLKRVGTAVAEGLGISLEGIAKGISSSTQSLGRGLGKLFGK